ncbi:MAG: tRNA-dihydrouridine synthase, partial [Candidatus Omnitrophota bacterium]
MAEAARILEELGYDVIDINFGCPVPKIAGKGSGCAFLAKPADAADVVREVVKAIKKAPVTIKTRLGISDPSGAQGAVLAKIAQDCGCAAITIHGRTQRQGYSGHAHYDGIRTIKQAVRIPVIGNGDVTNFITARRMLEQTGVDGIMIGRGCLGNPWVFRQLCDAFDGKTPPSDPSLEQRKKTLLEHLELELQTRDEKTVVLMMRRIACWYFKGLPQVSVFRGRINTCKTVELVRRAILEF